MKIQVQTLTGDTSEISVEKHPTIKQLKDSNCRTIASQIPGILIRKDGCVRRWTEPSSWA